MRVRKLLKTTGIVLLVAVVLALLAVAAFLYNPFEGTLADMRDIVPRDVDYFVRKTDLAQDFAEFPEPRFWESLAGSGGYRQMRNGPALRSIERAGIDERTIEQLRDGLRQLRDGTGGFLDLLRDGIGREVVVAGKLEPPRLENAQWLVCTRVTWRAKLALGLARYGFVQERVRQRGTVLRSEGGLLIAEPAGGKPVYVARSRDCVMVGNERTLVERSLALADGTLKDEAFGASSDYRDGVEKRLREWSETTGMNRPNAVEFYLRPDQLYPLVSWDDNWPNAANPQSMNERVLAAFLNLQGWRFLTGALVFDGQGQGELTLLARVDLNRNLHTAFQGRFFQTEAQSRQEWLEPFLSMVPINACAAAALRTPAGEFLKEMHRALGTAEKELLDEGLRKTGKYTRAEELIDRIQDSLLPRTGFVFRKNTPDADEKVVVANPSPIPQIAWVFWVRDEAAKKPLTDLGNLLSQYRDGFKLKAFEMPLNLAGRGGDQVLSFLNPQIPGTGEFAYLVFDRFFVVSNSAPLIVSMIQSRFGRQPSVLATQEMTAFQQDIPRLVNGFAFVNGREMEKVFQDYEADLDRQVAVPDPEWMAQNRARVENDVFRGRYSRFGSMAGMDSVTRKAFDQEVDKGLEDLWRREGRTVSAESRAAVRQWVGLSRLLSGLHFSVVFDPQSIRLTGRALMDYR